MMETDNDVVMWVSHIWICESCKVFVWICGYNDRNKMFRLLFITTKWI